MGLRALNNPASDFEDPFASTGLDAVQAPPITYPTCSGVHNTPTGASHFWDWSYSHDDQVGSVDFDSNSSQMTLNDNSEGIPPPPGWGCGGYGRIATKAADGSTGSYRTSQGSIPDYSAGDWTFDICFYVNAENDPASKAWMPYTVNNDGETYGMVHYYNGGNMLMDTVNSDFNGRLGENTGMGAGPLPVLDKWNVFRFRYDGTNWKNETFTENAAGDGWDGSGVITTTKTAGSQPNPSNGEGRIWLNGFGTHGNGSYGKDNVHYAWAAFYPNDTASVYVPS